MSTTRPLRDAMLAVSQLTVIPMPARWPGEEERPDIAGWFPLAGLIVGAAGWAVVSLADVIDAPVLLSAVAVALMALLTGGLHWDGLADVADAWHIRDPDRRQRVMKDSATGAFGALAIALTVAVQIAAVSVLAEKGAGAVLPIAAAAGRLSASFAAWLGRPARSEGLGAGVSRQPGFSAIIGVLVSLAGVAGVAAAGGLDPTSKLASVGVVVVAAFAPVVPHVISGRFNGTSGDTMGAGIVVVETVVLISSAAAVLL